MQALATHPTIPKGTLVYPGHQRPNGKGCELNGKNYSYGDKVTVETNDPKGNKWPSEVVCTEDGWKQV